MKIENFILQVAEQYDDMPTEGFTADTQFKENDEWSSMTALSIIAMVDQNYGVRLTGDEIKKASTISDIFEIVRAKQAPK